MTIDKTASPYATEEDKAECRFYKVGRPYSAEFKQDIKAAHTYAPMGIEHLENIFLKNHAQTAKYYQPEEILPVETWVSFLKTVSQYAVPNHVDLYIHPSPATLYFEKDAKGYLTGEKYTVVVKSIPVKIEGDLSSMTSSHIGELLARVVIRMLKNSTANAFGFYELRKRDTDFAIRCSSLDTTNKEGWCAVRARSEEKKC